MFNQYFGQYLYNKGLLSTAQMKQVLEQEQSVRLKLGVLAMNAGIMTAAQVQEVHDSQHRLDKRFGELAVAAGYITNDQVEELLAVQKRGYLNLSQVVVDLGYMTLAELEQTLIQYKHDSGLSEAQWKLLQSDEATTAGNVFLDFSLAGDFGQIYSEYVDLFSRSVVRFLNDAPVLARNHQLETVTGAYRVSQEIFGDFNLFSALIMDEATLLEVARRYSGEAIAEIDEMAIDSIGEFLNVVNGIFCVNLSDRGKELDLRPQHFDADSTLQLVNGQCIPLTLSFGEVKLIIGQNAK